MKILFSPLALDRIAEIEARLVEISGRATADRLLATIKEKTLLLSTMPRMGRVVPELGDVDVRELIIVPYRLVYQVRESARLIEVHTVVHSRQQFPLDEFLDD